MYLNMNLTFYYLLYIFFQFRVCFFFLSILYKNLKAYFTSVFQPLRTVSIPTITQCLVHTVRSILGYVLRGARSVFVQ